MAFSRQDGSLLLARRLASTGSRRGVPSKAPDSSQRLLQKLEEYDTPLTRKMVNPTSRAGFQPRDEPKLGSSVPTKFKIALNQKISGEDKTITYSRDTRFDSTYTDFCGLRFPTLDTTRNRNYWKDVGLNRLLPRIFPIKLPTHRKVDPLMREYIHFLHTLDPGRFRVERIGERYGLGSRPIRSRFKDSTVHKIIKEFSLVSYITTNKLCKLEDKRVDLGEQRMQIKEQAFRDNVGYIQSSDERAKEHDLEYKGDKDTVDWLHRQSVVVESMSAFPHASTRNGLPKRVDVDLTVKNDRHVKVINWIDPTDKIAF